ncbi:MAG: SH3 domain-containing protein [Thermoanaerobaculia bacterium]
MNRLKILVPGLLILAMPAATRPQQLPEAEGILGEAAAIDPEGDRTELVWVEPGTRIRRQPDAASPPITSVDARWQAPVLDRRGGWVQVLYGDLKGWIADPGSGPASSAAPAAPATDEGRLITALELLESGAEPLDLGSFELYTDVADRPLLRFLGDVAEGLPDAYRRRFGVDSGTGGGEAVILFSREQSYRDYATAVTAAAADLEAPGHAGYGLAALFVGGQTAAEVAAVLVHELTHLLNRRALSPALPPWLEEGIANDLAFSRIDGSGRLHPGSLGGRSVVVEEPAYRPGGWLGSDRAVHLSGPPAILRRLAEDRRAGKNLPLELLTDLLAGEFFHPDGRQARYDLSAFFVRYLLDGDLAARFRAFLAALAAGGSPASTAMRDHLERDWQALERGFAAWLDAGADGRRRRPRCNTQAPASAIPITSMMRPALERVGMSIPSAKETR